MIIYSWGSACRSICGPHDLVTVWSWSYGYLMIRSSSDCSLDELTTKWLYRLRNNPFGESLICWSTLSDGVNRWCRTQMSERSKNFRWVGHPRFLGAYVCGALWPAEVGPKRTTWRRSHTEGLRSSFRPRDPTSALKFHHTAGLRSSVRPRDPTGLWNPLRHLPCAPTVRAP